MTTRLMGYEPGSLVQEQVSSRQMVLDKRLSNARLIIDYSAKDRNANIIAAWQQLAIFGKGLKPWAK